MVPSSGSHVVFQNKPALNGGRFEPVNEPAKEGASNRLKLSPSASAAPVLVATRTPPKVSGPATMTRSLVSVTPVLLISTDTVPARVKALLKLNVPMELPGARVPFTRVSPPTTPLPASVCAAGTINPSAASSIAPPITVNSELLPTEPAPVNASVPVVTVVGPVNVLDAESVTTADPLFIIPPDPETTPSASNGPFANSVRRLPPLLSAPARVKVPLTLLIVVGLLNVESIAHVLSPTLSSPARSISGLSDRKST